MRDDAKSTTRRRYLRYGSALVGSGLLAGCAGDSGSEPAETAASETQDAAGTGAATETSETAARSAYSVEMAPVGSVTFDAPPESVTHYFPDYGDMSVALGHGDTILSMGLPSRYHTSHYDELEGVGVDVESMTKLNGDSGIDKEVFYELNGDLHMVDPRWLVNNSFFGLDSSDVQELSENVAPFIGNTIFRRSDGWHDYRYYTLYEAFEKVARVHREEEKYAELKQLHDEFIDSVRSDLPPADDRPNALLTFASGDQPETFYPYRVSDKGTNKKQFRDLGITDALAGTGIEGLSTTDRGQIDYETMLEVDPDSLLVRGHEGKSRKEFVDTVLAFMKQHEVASELTAVQNDMVFRGGPIYAGPLHNLFLTERYATLYYPDTYSGALFDRQRVSGIVNGEH